MRYLKPKIKETQVKKMIMEYLAILEKQKKIWCFRAGSGTIETKQGNWFKTGKSGCPDIVCCLPKGKFLGLEAKSSVGGQQSIAQKEAEGRIKMLGGEYHIVRSIEEVYKLLKSIKWQRIKLQQLF